MRLNRRETIFVAVGAAALLVLGVYFLAIEPLIEARDRYDGLTERLGADLAEIEMLSEQYQGIRSGEDELDQQVQARGPDFSPFGYLENLAQQVGLSGRIESMTPLPVSESDGGPRLAEFDLRLAGIGLAELIPFLYRLEIADGHFFVVNMEIRPRYLTPDLLDVSLRLATPAAS